MILLSATLLIVTGLIVLWIVRRRERMMTITVGALDTMRYAPGDKITYSGVRYKVVDLFPGTMKVRRLGKRTQTA